MDDSREHRIEEKVDGIVHTIGHINVTLAKQAVILDEHIRRTELLEKQVLPIQKHVYTVNGVLKVLVIVSIVVGILASIAEVFRAIK